MVNTEQSGSGNPETELNPEAVAERAADDVLSSQETEESMEANASNKAVQNAGKYIIGGAKAGGGLALSGLFFAGKIVWGLAEFVKKVIDKKGNITFQEGYDIGQGMINPESKERKKK